MAPDSTSDGVQRLELDELFSATYEELRRLASKVSQDDPSGTLNPTALVNEAYMRLVDYQRMQWQNRAHFMAVSAQAMRRILVDHARGTGCE